MTDITVRLPPLDELALRWAEIEPYIRRATALAEGCYEPIDILRLTMAGQMTIWIAESEGAIDAVAVASVLAYPRKRILDVPLIGGDNMRDWLSPMLAAIEEHARQFGCTMITGHGRRGWARAAGFEENASLVRHLT